MKRNKHLIQFVDMAVGEAKKVLPNMDIQYDIDNLGCTQIQEIMSYILKHYPKIGHDRWIMHKVNQMAQIKKESLVQLRDDVKIFLMYALLEGDRTKEANVKWISEADLEDILGMMLFSYNAELSKDDELLRGVVLLVKRER